MSEALAWVDGLDDLDSEDLANCTEDSEREVRASRIIAAEVRRLRDRRYNHDIELAEKLRLTEADLAAARAEAARLRERVQKAAERCTCEAFEDDALEGK